MTARSCHLRTLFDRDPVMAFATQHAFDGVAAFTRPDCPRLAFATLDDAGPSGRARGPIAVNKPSFLLALIAIVTVHPPTKTGGRYSGDGLRNGWGRVALTTLCDHLGDVGPRHNVPLTAGVDHAGQQGISTTALLGACAIADFAGNHPMT